jgi:hypothetical protein
MIGDRVGVNLITERARFAMLAFVTPENRMIFGSERKKSKKKLEETKSIIMRRWILVSERVLFPEGQQGEFRPWRHATSSSGLPPS